MSDKYSELVRVYREVHRPSYRINDEVLVKTRLQMKKDATSLDFTIIRENGYDDKQVVDMYDIASLINLRDALDLTIQRYQTSEEIRKEEG